ncbi:unnamed protein product [Miscanthus lutarioriparius]|uniref:Thioredoxin domain-containing protein n=1 Tax=Miscanthus lutarioriparius TaxID=422564 RepID=A0A811QKY2_9POAL|nr:unnamed protein product [Miscanthus lutarioriparius]
MASAPSTTAPTLAPSLRTLVSSGPRGARLPAALRLSCAQPGPAGCHAAPGRLARPRARVRCGAAARFIGQGEFPAEVLESELPVLVDFVADWCGPCRLIAPVVDWASEEYAGRLKIVKIDHDANPQLIEEYKVFGLPTLILFKNGQEVPGSRYEGAMIKDKFKQYLEPLLTTTVA